MFEPTGRQSEDQARINVKARQHGPGGKKKGWRKWFWLAIVIFMVYLYFSGMVLK